MGHWRQPVLLFILPKKPQKMNDFSSFLAVFFYGLMSQSHEFVCFFYTALHPQSALFP